MSDQGLAEAHRRIADAEHSIERRMLDRARDTPDPHGEFPGRRRGCLDPVDAGEEPTGRQQADQSTVQIAGLFHQPHHRRLHQVQPRGALVRQQEPQRLLGNVGRHVAQPPGLPGVRVGVRGHEGCQPVHRVSHDGVRGAVRASRGGRRGTPTSSSSAWTTGTPVLSSRAVATSPRRSVMYRCVR